jgi:hypothetical protein
MSFNRNKYDKCAYNLQMERSTNPGDYRLAAEFAENCDQCFSSFGPVGSKSDVSLVKENMDLSFKEMTEVESALSWRNQLLSKCNNNATPLNKFNVHHKTVCNNSLTPEDTRFTFPLDNFRGMSLTEYMLEPYLHVNPQCMIQHNDDKIGLNSRLNAKDNYKLVNPKMVDSEEALPKEIPTPKKICNV